MREINNFEPPVWDDDPTERLLMERPATPPVRPTPAKLGDSWRPVNLRSVLDGGYEAPAPTVGEVAGDVPLFYPGRINSVFGDSGGGKTWALLMAAAQVMSGGGDVVLIDYEDHAAATVHRLELLGVERATIIEHLVYVNPAEKWGGIAEAMLQLSLEQRDPKLAIIDSTGEGMAVDAVNPNSDDEVARWFRGCARWLADTGAAVVLLDHIVKAQMGNSRAADFATGSQRKRAAINGAAYHLDVVTPPSREHGGMFKLIVRKDRFGHRKHGATACEVRMDNDDDGGITWSISAPVASKDANGNFRPTTLMEKVSRLLEGEVDPMGVRTVKAQVNGKDSAVARAIEVLLEERYIEQEPGPRNSKLCRSVKPFRKDDDDGGPF